MAQTGPSGVGQTNIVAGGVVGVQGQMHGGTVVQNMGGVDFAKLTAELARLELLLAGAATADPKLSDAAEHVAEAKAAAEKQDEQGLGVALLKAGRTALDFALKLGEKIAVPITVAWLTKSVGG
jgi:hypothetical protein